MEEYYTYIHGEIKGPYTVAELKELEITPETRIGIKNADGDIAYKQASLLDNLSELFIEPIPAKTTKAVEKKTPKSQKPAEESKLKVEPTPLPIEPVQGLNPNIETIPNNGHKSWINSALIVLIVFLIGLAAYWERDKIINWFKGSAKTEDTNKDPNLPKDVEKKTTDDTQTNGMPTNSPEYLVQLKKCNELALQADNALRSGDFKSAYDKMRVAAIIRRESAERGTKIEVSGKAKEMYKDLTADARDILIKTENIQLGDDVNLEIAKNYLELALIIDNTAEGKLNEDIKECKRRLKEYKNKF
jgi:hypothetical protein